MSFFYLCTEFIYNINTSYILYFYFRTLEVHADYSRDVGVFMNEHVTPELGER